MASNRRRNAKSDDQQQGMPLHSSRGAVVATILLLLPIVYLASYLALVRPGGVTFSRSYTKNGIRYSEVSLAHYALIGREGERYFWPIERLDRKLRPATWEANRGLLGD